MGYTFRQNMVPILKTEFKCPYDMKPDGIVIHNTANDASADNEIRYMISNTNYVSYHVAVDDKEVIQAIPFNKNAFHTGDGITRKSGNRTKIGIEICYSRSGGDRYKQAEENAIQYIAKLLKSYGWGIDRVSKHQDYSGKYCPHRILDERRWNEVLQRIEKALKGEGERKLELSKSQREAMAKVYENAHKKGIFSSNEHAEDVRNEEMTVDKAVYLTTLLVDEALKK